MKDDFDEMIAKIHRGRLAAKVATWVIAALAVGIWIAVVWHPWS